MSSSASDFRVWDARFMAQDANLTATSATLGASITALQVSVSALTSQYAALGMTDAGMAAQIAVLNAAISALQAAMVALPASTTLPGKYTLAGAAGYTTLPAASADNLGLYATVVDLFGEKEDKVLCSRIGTTYFWQPVRPNFTKTVALTSNIALDSLTSPATLFLSGTLGVSIGRTVTLPTSGVWPGQTYDIASDVVMGIGSTLNVLGTGLGSGISVLTGARKRFSYEWAVGWKQFT